IYQRIIDNALWGMVRRLTGQGCCMLVVGLTDSEIKQLETEENEARTITDIALEKLSQAPMLRHMERDRPLVIILYTNPWAFGAAVCQEHDGILHPVRFVSKVFKDTETRYTSAEEEVLALVKTLHTASHYLLGQAITVYTRYSLMKWLLTSKRLTGRAKITSRHEEAMAHAHFFQQKLMEERVAAQNENVANPKASTTRREYQVGELVWLYHELVKPGLVRKLAHLWHGPYAIEERVSEVVYRLISGTPEYFQWCTFQGSIKPYVSRIRRPVGRAQVEGTLAFDQALLPEDSWLDEDVEAGEYEVEEIMDCRYMPRVRNGRRQREYLVKWVGYEEQSWVAEEDLSCTAL
ncbi:TPA: LOW QUALITY PROTEIN: hypothetical protein N0F65_007128, partial [Lagenidium giganteum]